MLTGLPEIGRNSSREIQPLSLTLASPFPGRKPAAKSKIVASWPIAGDIAYRGIKTRCPYGYRIRNLVLEVRFEEVSSLWDLSDCRAQVPSSPSTRKTVSMHDLKFRDRSTGRVVCGRLQHLQLQLRRLVGMSSTRSKWWKDPEQANGQKTIGCVLYQHGQKAISMAAWICRLSTSASRCSLLQFRMDGPHCNPAALDVLKKMSSGEAENKDNPIWKDWKNLKIDGLNPNRRRSARKPT